MSTSISLPSEPGVALLWGGRWWISGASEPVPVSDPAQAAETLRQYYADTGRPARLRLLYQPDTLLSVAATCPHGNRSTVQTALQEEYPALADPTRAWGFEPITRGSNATLLHYETEPGLLPLVAALHAGGIEVEGAWPLVSALNLIPEDWPDTGALTVIAVAEHQAVIYRHTPSGAREVECATGEAAALTVSATLQAVFEREDTAVHIVSLVAPDQEPAVLHPHAQPHGWEDVVRAARSLSTTLPHQLLPVTTRFPVVRTASGVCLLAAGLLGAAPIHAAFSQWSRHDRHQQEAAVLQQEVDALRRNEAEIQQLRLQLSPHARRVATLLRTVGGNLPAALVVTRIQTDSGGFTLEGGISDPALAASAWPVWWSTFQAADQPWHWPETIPPSPTADFSVRGSWR